MNPPPELAPVVVRRKVNSSTLGGFAAIFLWSTTIALTRSVTERLGPLTAGSCVYLLAGVFGMFRFGQTRPAQGPLPPQSRRYLYGCGFLFVSCNVLLYLAVGLAANRQQVLQVGLVNYLWPSLTILLAVPLLGKRARFGLVPGTGLALAGLFLVLTEGQGTAWKSFVHQWRLNPAAYLLAGGAALSWALYSNLVRRWARPSRGGATAAFLLATGLVLLALRFASKESHTASFRGWIEAAALGGITAAAYSLWDEAMRRGNLLLVAAGSYATPLLSTLVSCAYLQVALGLRLGLGAVLLVAGSLLSWRSVEEPAEMPRQAGQDFSRRSSCS